MSENILDDIYYDYIKSYDSYHSAYLKNRNSPQMYLFCGTRLNWDLPNYQNVIFQLVFMNGPNTKQYIIQNNEPIYSPLGPANLLFSYSHNNHKKIMKKKIMILNYQHTPAYTIPQPIHFDASIYTFSSNDPSMWQYLENIINDIPIDYRMEPVDLIENISKSLKFLTSNQIIESTHINGNDLLDASNILFNNIHSVINNIRTSNNRSDIISAICEPIKIIGQYIKSLKFINNISNDEITNIIMNCYRLLYTNYQKAKNLKTLFLCNLISLLNIPVEIKTFNNNELYIECLIERDDYSNPCLFFLKKENHFEHFIEYWGKNIHDSIDDAFKNYIKYNLDANSINRLQLYDSHIFPIFQKYNDTQWNILDSNKHLLFGKKILDHLTLIKPDISSIQSLIKEIFIVRKYLFTLTHKLNHIFHGPATPYNFYNLFIYPLIRIITFIYYQLRHLLKIDKIMAKSTQNHLSINYHLSIYHLNNQITPKDSNNLALIKKKLSDKNQSNALAQNILSDIYLEIKYDIHTILQSLHISIPYSDIQHQPCFLFDSLNCLPILQKITI